MKTIAVLVGSLRKNSYNRKLFQVCNRQAPDELRFIDVPVALPLFNEENEDPFPPEVVAFRKALQESDGILIISPEYNRSIPGGLKNAIDWASRADNVFSGKRVATAGVTVGRLGTAPMQQHLRSILVYFNTHVMGQPELQLAGAATLFDDTGAVTDKRTAESIQKYLAALGEFFGH